MKIQEVSKKFDLTADTLRYYERIGLLPPGMGQRQMLCLIIAVQRLAQKRRRLIQRAGVQGHHAQTAITRTRLRAEKAGWLPPLAWDDDTIDDPNLPAPVHARRPAKSWQRIYVDDVAELAALGATWAELEHRVGACRNSIEIALTRAGRTELIGRITSNRWVAA